MGAATAGVNAGLLFQALQVEPAGLRIEEHRDSHGVARGATGAQLAYPSGLHGYGYCVRTRRRWRTRSRISVYMSMPISSATSSVTAIA